MYTYFIALFCSMVFVFGLPIVIFSIIKHRANAKAEEAYNRIKQFQKTHAIGAIGSMTVKQWEEKFNYRSVQKPDTYNTCKHCKFYFKSSGSDYGDYEHGYCKLRRRQGNDLDGCTVYKKWKCQHFTETWR